MVKWRAPCTTTFWYPPMAPRSPNVPSTLRLRWHAASARVSPVYQFPSRDEYEKQAAIEAELVLKDVQQACAAAGIECTLKHGIDSHPYRLILATAKEQGCDLICMSSHGRRGLSAMLLGSETQKVLTHGDLPVLVVR